MKYSLAMRANETYNENKNKYAGVECQRNANNPNGAVISMNKVEYQYICRK